MRQQVLMNETIRFDFSERCEKLNLAKSKSRINFMLNKLMTIYITGMFDAEMKVDTYLAKSTNPKIRVNMDKALKTRFEYRAWKRGLIKYPHYGVRALELMMQLFLDGKLNKKIEEYEQDALEKNN